VQAALRGGRSRATQERTKRQIEGLRQRSSDERRLVEAALEAATPVQGYSRHEIVSLELGMALGKDLVSDLGSQILELSELEGPQDFVDRRFVAPGGDELVEGRRPAAAREAEPAIGRGKGASESAQMIVGPRQIGAAARAEVQLLQAQRQGSVAAIAV
jgi:hypothetical protein